jgi:hypothetical protein
MNATSIEEYCAAADEVRALIKEINSLYEKKGGHLRFRLKPFFCATERDRDLLKRLIASEIAEG